MANLDKHFTQAQKAINELAVRPSNKVLLKLYGLFKQGTEGDVSGDRPGVLDIKNRAKFDSWKDLRGMDRNSAKMAYVKLAIVLVKKTNQRVNV